MVDIENLTVYYGRLLALKNISFSARRGEILGLLGPNGAGKSTIMKCLTTQIIPRRGRIMIMGTDIAAAPMEAKRHIGYLPENPPLYPEMEVSEYLDFVAEAHGLSSKQRRQRKAWAVEHCGLDPVYRKMLSSLSKGYRQRVGLAQCLIHDPEVIILDEPTSGLDPLQILEIRELIRKLAKNKTVIFSTHILQEAAAMSHHVVMIHEGRVVTDRSLADLLSPKYKGVLKITVAAEPDEFEDMLASIPGSGTWRLTGTDQDGLSNYELRDYAPNFWMDFSLAVASRGIPVRRFYDPPPDLEEVFVHLTKETGGKKIDERRTTS